MVKDGQRRAAFVQREWLDGSKPALEAPDRRHCPLRRRKKALRALLIDADRDLLQAKLDLRQIRLNELLSIVQLYKTLGGGWQS